MERFYKHHQGLIFIIGVIASIITFTFVTFATQKSLDDFKGDVRDDIKEIKSDIKLLLQKE